MQLSFKLLQAFTIEKEPGIPNEDCFLVSGSRRAIAVCDGASQSYDSATWAELLCRAFIEDHCVDKAWIARAAADYNSSYALSDLPWIKQAAFERGSFSTLLGIEALSDATLRVAAFGDSLVVISDRDRFVESFPYQEPESFFRLWRHRGEALEQFFEIYLSIWPFPCWGDVQQWRAGYRNFRSSLRFHLGGRLSQLRSRRGLPKRE